ncbi:MFS transporter [Agreia sp. VKM Ac-1783]|uniref:MFS transporter n=1 Tax=Agreia sp. VKM Ac-1783 TaxID=1938889 RepID=UPI000A2AB2D7|nr:MFS transporter [Agreia sp. VKM Ac-1783]SMQ70846.1 Predicted arabinose efflux permease, MFS family [Agreia sp. VKM Ac-1783]
MRPLATTGTKGVAFWTLVLASTAGHIVNGATTPVIPRLAQEQLGADPALAGLLVSLAAFASIIAMPLAGVLTDRWGARRVILVAALLSAVGLALVLVMLSVSSLAVSRVVFGAGNAAVATALTAWVVAEAPAGERGRALSFFGLSVWVGLALGPVLGENLLQSFGHRAVWGIAIAVQLAGLGLAMLARDGRSQHRMARGREGRASGASTVLTSVARPGSVGFIAWAGEGFLIAFLIPHLVARGVDSQGLWGAANVFTVFALSVVGARLLLGGLPDRIGATITARASLVVLAAGLGVLALAGDFGVATLGAVLIGVGYSPLFPALTLLSTQRLPAAARATGVGVFSAFTSAGYAAGSLLGGLLVMHFGSSAALAILAVLQLAAIGILRQRRDGRAEPVPAVEPPLV